MTFSWFAPRGAMAALMVSLALSAACSATTEPSDRAGAQLETTADDDSSERSAGRAVRRFRSTRVYETVPPPVRLRIPVIDVSTPLHHLGRNADGTIEIPTEWDVAGWFKGGAKPGQPGPAAILGHVDSTAGPAVFYRLRELRKGDKIFVDQRAGHEVKFVVKRIEQHDKDSFPTDDVYFPTLKPRLSLITCGGSFDRSVGHYRDNVIVFAVLAD